MLTRKVTFQIPPEPRAANALPERPSARGSSGGSSASDVSLEHGGGVGKCGWLEVADGRRWRKGWGVLFENRFSIYDSDDISVRGGGGDIILIPRYF
jgi:hypothetical protein